MAVEEARLRFSIIAQVGNASTGFTQEDAMAAIFAGTGVENGTLVVTPLRPGSFLVVCTSQATRDRILAANPIPLASTALSVRPWTRLAFADDLTIYSKIKLELVGIPAHAWDLGTVSKLLAPFCWVERLDPATADKTDLTQFVLTAWTQDPLAIPQSKTLLIAEPEAPVVYDDPGMERIFAGVTPYLRQKRFLAYQVDFHLRSIADFGPRRSPTSSSSSPLDDSDSGPDRNPDRSDGFRRGDGGPRLQGFPRRDAARAGGGHRGRAAPETRGTSGGPTTATVSWATARRATEKVGDRPAKVGALQRNFPKADTNKSGATKESTGVVVLELSLNEEDKTTGRSSLERMPGLVKTGKAAEGQQRLRGCHPWAVECETACVRKTSTPQGQEFDPMWIEAGLAAPPKEDKEANGKEASDKEAYQRTPEDPGAWMVLEPMGNPMTGPPPPGPIATELDDPRLEGSSPSEAGREDGPMARETEDEQLGYFEDGAGPNPVATETGLSATPTLTSPLATNEPSTPARCIATVSTPATETPSDNAKLSAFAKAVQKKIRSPLAPKPVKTKRTAPTQESKGELPKRSERIANQPLAKVPTSRRAEVLLMQKLGLATGPAPTKQ
ncbi:unnamed protein product [Urochloa humidicola]